MGLEGSSGGILPLEATIGSRRTFRLPLHAWADIVGVALLLLLVAVTVAASRGDRSGLITLLLASGGALVVGRGLGTIRRALVPAAVMAAATVVAIGALVGGDPFGFEGATSAVLAQGAIAGALLAVPVVAGSRWARPAVVLCALVFLIVLSTTISLGAIYREGDGATGLEGELRSVLTEHRVALWHSALEILTEDPGGVGPGRFDDAQPKFLPEGDVRWAENDFLQQGAELGWAGLVLTVLLFLWGFARSLVHPAPDATVALGAVALAALGIHACVSHVLHVPAVPLVAALLIGSTQAVRARGTGPGLSGP